MATNDFLVFGGGAGANVMTQAAWAALAARTAGFSSGVAQSAQLNKAWRQSSIMAALLGQLIADKSGQNAVDDGTVATLESNLIAAVKACATEQILSSLATSGYVKIPTAAGTLIVQWGQANGSTTSTDYKTYPVAFTVGAYMGCASYAGFSQQGFGNAFQPVSATQFLLTNQNSSGVPQTGLTNWIAIGK